MARSTLWQETAETIHAYLGGRLSSQEAAAWAVGIIAQETFLSDELLLEQTILTLLELHDPGTPFATAKQDLEQLLACLLGTQTLQLELHYSPQTLAVKKKKVR
jgi:hypothetical protein